MRIKPYIILGREEGDVEGYKVIPTKPLQVIYFDEKGKETKITTILYKEIKEKKKILRIIKQCADFLLEKGIKDVLEVSELLSSVLDDFEYYLMMEKDNKPPLMPDLVCIMCKPERTLEVLKKEEDRWAAVDDYVKKCWDKNLILKQINLYND